MDKADAWFEEKIIKLKTKLVIYRNVLGNKNIVDHKLIGIILELIYSNIITINEFLEISKDIIKYKTENIRYLNKLDKEHELEIRVSKSNCFTREKVEELRLNLQIQANKDFLKFFVNKTKNMIENKKKIDIRQLELFENYRKNRI